MKNLTKKLTAMLLCAAIFLTLAMPAMAAPDPLVNPAEAFIIECLETVPEVAVIGAVTEDNDPNGKLNTAGGYTAAVYFSSTLLSADAASMTAAEVIEEGTSCGGCIEVYSTLTDAEARYEYLQSLKALAGESFIVGTVVVRTSSYLGAEDAIRLKNAVISALEEKAYGDAEPEEAEAPAAEEPAEEPAAEAEPEINVRQMVENYLFQGIYLEYTMAALAKMDIAGSAYNNIGDSSEAFVYPTIDGNGYYVFEYNITEADQQVHVTRITFVQTFASDDLSTMALSISGLCSAVGILPSFGTEEFVDEATELMTALDAGESYVSGNTTVRLLWSETADGLMVCLVIDGLDSI